MKIHLFHRPIPSILNNEQNWSLANTGNSLGMRLRNTTGTYFTSPSPKSYTGKHTVNRKTLQICKYEILAHHQERRSQLPVLPVGVQALPSGSGENTKQFGNSQTIVVCTTWSGKRLMHSAYLLVSFQASGQQDGLARCTTEDWGGLGEGEEECFL